MDQFISKEVLDILSYHSTLGRSLKQISLRKTPLPIILDDIEIEDIPSFEETEETFAPTLNFEENNEPVTIEEEKKVE